MEKCILGYTGALDRTECLMIMEMYGDTCVVVPHLGCLIDVAWMRSMFFGGILGGMLLIVIELSLLSRPPIY